MKIKLLACFVFVLSFFVYENNVYADVVMATSSTELENYVNTATEDRTITIDQNFPSLVTTTMNFKDNTNYTITIDFGNNELISSGTNPILTFTNGTSTFGGNLILKNALFSGNGGSQRAIYANGYLGNLTLENVTIDNFHAPDDGGAMYVGGNTIIKNSTFLNNSSNASGYSGGAIGSKNFSSSLTVENSLFKNNKTLALGTGPVGGEGGALYFYTP